MRPHGQLLRPICIEQAVRHSLYSFKYILDPICKSFTALTLLFFPTQILHNFSDTIACIPDRPIYHSSLSVRLFHPLYLVCQLTMRKLLIGPYFIFLVVFVGVVLVRDSFTTKWSVSYSQGTPSISVRGTRATDGHESIKRDILLLDQSNMVSSKKPYNWMRFQPNF